MTHASRYIIIIVTIVIVPDSDKVYAISMYLLALKIMLESIKVHDFQFPFTVS